MVFLFCFVSSVLRRRFANDNYDHERSLGMSEERTLATEVR